MCAIFGVGMLKGHRVSDPNMLKNVVRRLMIAAQARGSDASGLIVSDGKTARYYKKNISASRFVAEDGFSSVKEHLSSGKTRLVIGHTRMETQGSNVNNDNNHPIHCGNVVGVHNGVIINDSNLFNEFAGIIQRKAQVDSEIIFALINHFINTHNAGNNIKISRAISMSSEWLQGSYACAMTHAKHTDTVWLFRNNNPCVIKIYKAVGVIVWASVEMYIDTAMSRYISVVGKPDKLELPANQGIGINLSRNELNRFKLS